MVTKSKNLRTGRSIWEAFPAPRVPHRPLEKNVDTDVLIVGAGITGAMLADALVAAGFDITLVDKRGPAKGSTAASTALVLHEIDTPLIKLSKKIGRRNAVRAWQRSRLAVDAIAARLGELGVRSIERRGSLYLAGDLLGRDGLAREDAARRSAGLVSRYLNRDALGDRFGISRAAALLSYDDITINPREATLMLLNAACARTAKIFSPCEIVAIDAGKRSVTATAGNGLQIRSRHLVFATGYELPEQVPRRGHRIISTWAIATVPQKHTPWPEQSMIWEASETYLYLRTTPDGRIVCGGEDENFSDENKRDALLDRKTRILARKLRQLIPTADTDVDFAWTGSFGVSATGLPKIGRIQAMPRCWAALGYGGNGTTYARIAADVICGALTGRPDADADLYRL